MFLSNTRLVMLAIMMLSSSTKTTLTTTSRRVLTRVDAFAPSTIRRTSRSVVGLDGLTSASSSSSSSSLLSRPSLINTAAVTTTTRSFGTSLDMATVAPDETETSTATATKAATNVPANDNEDDAVEDLPTNDSDDELLRIRHSSAHVMAMAVQKIYPEAQVTIGPWIDNGFYYDFYFPDKVDESTGEVIEEGRKLTDSDLKQVKKQMDKIISKNYPITREEVSREEAERRIKELNEPFKLEILQGLEEPITLYHIGDEWWDLCAGPHVESTGKIPKKAVALQSVAGAYWRGDENREMLQRIYATAWKDPGQLKQYKKMLEEAKKRDHRLLGQKLDLFSIQEEAGGGLVFWHPKGSKVRQKIEDFWKSSHDEAGYDLVYSPHIANLDLWKTSGHFDFYRSDMFDQMEVENEEYQIKPMNCPFHVLMYKDSLRSYRDLPIRWAELGTVYRYERSGTLHGLMRVRGFTQDDAHIFCLPDQLEDEIVGVLDLTETILTRFGFNKYDIMLSTRPEKSVGSDKIWEDATTALEGALKKKGWFYGVDEGGGAFYGPKIDVKIRDAIGRQWQCSTIQCDFNLPERFGLEYVTSESSRERPIMVHRAIFGSLERFFGILTENCSGNFPLWLAPVQLKILPVTDAVHDYCQEVAAKAKKLGIRVEIDRGSERLNKQVRNAEQQRVPIMAIVGMSEMESGSLSIRSKELGDRGTFTVDELLEEVVQCSTDAVEMTKMGKVEPNEEA